MSSRPQTMELVESPNGSHVRVDGKLMTFAQAHGAYGVVGSNATRVRIKEGWTVVDAMFTPGIDGLPYWGKMSLNDRIALVTKLHGLGLQPKDMVAHARGIRAQTLTAFCAIHLPAAVDQSDEEQGKEEKLVGWTLHSRSVDGDGVPDTGPLSLLQLNNDTCKFPVSPKDVEPRHLLFCGCRVSDSGPYCPEHTRRSHV